MKAPLMLKHEAMALFRAASSKADQILRQRRNAEFVAHLSNLPANPDVPELRLSKHSDVKMSHATAYYRLCPALNLLFIILLFKSSLSSFLHLYFQFSFFLIMSPLSSSPHLLL